MLIILPIASVYGIVISIFLNLYFYFIVVFITVIAGSLLIEANELLWSTPKRVAKIEWKNLYSKHLWIRSLMYGLCSGLTLCLISVLFVNKSYLNEVFLFLFLFMLVAFLISGIITESLFLGVKYPYSSFKKEALYLQLKGILVLILPVIVGSYFNNKINNCVDLLMIVIFELVIGTILGFLWTSLFKHFILRLCLFLEKKLPLQLVHFLQYTTQARILEQDGGQWRFRHQILQDYFAERYGGNVNRNG